jgi:outer membrane protein assembly factor BamE (lipoprotein component of BamABCDE complex)
LFPEPGENPMSQQWYYAKGGQRQGPVVDEELKRLAATGQLQASDLVWKEGMAQWVEASKIKGLFPAEVLPPSPPALPSAEIALSAHVEHTKSPSPSPQKSATSPTDLAKQGQATEKSPNAEPSAESKHVLTTAAVVRAIKLLAFSVLGFVAIAALTNSITEYMAAKEKTEKANKKNLEMSQDETDRIKKAAEKHLMEASKAAAVDPTKGENAKAETDSDEAKKLGLNPPEEKTTQGDESKLLDRDVFKKLVIGKTKTQILDLLGKPEETSEIGPYEYWNYKTRTKDSVTDKVDGTVVLAFQDDKVTMVAVSNLSRVFSGAQAKAAKTQISELEKMVEAYHFDVGTYPSSLDALIQPPGDVGNNPHGWPEEGKPVGAL